MDEPLNQTASSIGRQWTNSGCGEEWGAGKDAEDGQDRGYGRKIYFPLVEPTSTLSSISLSHPSLQDSFPPPFQIIPHLKPLSFLPTPVNTSEPFQISFFSLLWVPSALILSFPAPNSFWHPFFVQVSLYLGLQFCCWYSPTPLYCFWRNILCIRLARPNCSRTVVLK